ncbi:MAG: family transcriptional regulator, cyclic receptor protein [Pseudonocardiales bacterium]|jgi:CRP-like cAMP-binding protein|nr:family transcriptional regulator, cyclic receptor protein [Pseudonocardiales bacterium]
MPYRHFDLGIVATEDRLTIASAGIDVGHTGSVSNLLPLCADLPTRSWRPGEVLIEHDEVPAQMYVLASGSVTVERDGVAFARINTPGAIFGEMSFVLGRSATATVRASSDVACHVIDDPEAFLTERPGAALAVLRTTAARLDGMTRYLVDVKQQLAGEAGHLGMVGQILDTLLHHQTTARPGSVRDPEG